MTQLFLIFLAVVGGITTAGIILGCLIRWAFVEDELKKAKRDYDNLNEDYEDLLEKSASDLCMKLDQIIDEIIEEILEEDDVIIPTDDDTELPPPSDGEEPATLPFNPQA